MDYDKVELFEQKKEEKNTIAPEYIQKDFGESIFLKFEYNFTDKDIEKIIKLSNRMFVFIFNYKVKSGIGVTSSNLITILKEDLIPVREIKLDDKIQYICEIKEEEIYLIFSQKNKVYLFAKDFDYPKMIIDMKIYFILQIKRNKYIISNEIGIFIYEGSILDIAKGELKEIINIKKEKKRIYYFGIKINQDKIALLNNEEIMILDVNEDQKKVSFSISNFHNYENCYALFKSKEDTDILLLGCYQSEKSGILIIEAKDKINDFFLEIKDFEINCFFPIYEEEIIKAFSESYDENYIYFLLNGIKKINETRRNIIELFKFNLDAKTLDDVKSIWEENNNESYLSYIIKSIIQNKYQNLIINFKNGNTMKFSINKLKNEIEIVKSKNEDFSEENNELCKLMNEICDKMNEEDTIELVKIGYKKPKSKNTKKDSNKNDDQNLVKFIYQLKYKNKDLFIVLKNRIFVINNNFEIIDEFYLDHEICCICQKSESEVLFV